MKKKIFIIFIVVTVFLGFLLFCGFKIFDYLCSDYEVQGFKIGNQKNKVSKVVIDTKNTNIIFMPKDYDEGACQICGHHLTKDFDIEANGEVMYVKNKNITNFEAQKIKIVLPLYFINDIEFEVNCVGGDLIFGSDFDDLQKEDNLKNKSQNHHIVNIKSISGTVYGNIEGGILKVGNINLKISGENNLQEISAKVEHIEKI